MARKRDARGREKLSPGGVVFRWQVPADGFEWVEAPRAPLPQDPSNRVHDAGPWLVARGSKGEWYQPLHDPERGPFLFRFLADVTDRFTALAFANKYGALGVPEGILGDADETKKSRPRPVVEGESLSRWIREAAQLRAAVRVAEAARFKDYRSLHKWIRLRTGRGAILLSHPDLDDELAFERDAAYQVLGPKLPGLGLLFAQKLINARLDADTAYRVLADAPGRLVLGIAPRHLLAAAWLQLAQWLTDENPMERRQCRAPGCREWWTIGRGGSREDRVFCGDACRKRVERAPQRARRK